MILFLLETMLCFLSYLELAASIPVFMLRIVALKKEVASPSEIFIINYQLSRRNVADYFNLIGK